ncbi:hypothetical protein TNCV_1041411 [Trichonephila clavipes]|nr:hypothetical protein TNCV_1041411 [Trichonephila clavipes]
MLCDKCTWPWGHCLLLFELGKAPTPRLAVIMVKRELAPNDNRRSLSCRLGRCQENGIIEHRWCDGQELWHSWSRRSESVFCVLRSNRTREAETDFCGLPIRRDEGLVVGRPGV